MLDEGAFWKQLRHGSHSLGIFSDDKAHCKMAFGFMKAGLENGELATYITPEDPLKVKGEMELEWDQNFHTWDAKKQVQVISSSVLFPHGFSIKPTLSSFAETYQKTIAEGFTGWRVVDVTFYPQEEEHLRRLVACDKEYNNLGIGVTALCMYQNIERYEFELFADLLFCHGQIVSQKQKILGVSERFLHSAIDSSLGEIFGENGAKAILSHIAKVIGAESTDKLFDRVKQEPELLRRGLSEIFGESSYSVCRMVKEKLAEITVDSIM